MQLGVNTRGERDRERADLVTPVGFDHHGVLGEPEQAKQVPHRLGAVNRAAMGGGHLRQSRRR